MESCTPVLNERMLLTFALSQTFYQRLQNLYWFWHYHLFLDYPLSGRLLAAL